MPDILIRDISVKTLQRLKQRARRQGRSLQQEAKQVLDQAAGLSASQARTLLRSWQARLAGRSFTSAAKLVREDRQR